MNRDAVAVVEAIYQAIASSDPALFRLLAPDIEWVTPVTLPWGLPGANGRYAGHAELVAYFRNTTEQVADLRVEVEDLLLAGPKVLMVGRELGTSRATGRSFTARCAHLWTVEGGLAVRLDGFPDTATMWAAFDR